MDESEFDHAGPLLQAVCEEAVAIVGTDVDDIYLYAEVEEDSVFAALFRMEETVMRYHGPTPELFKCLRKAWLTSKPDKRWFVMQCDIYGNQFDAKFEFPEDFLKNESATDRCCREIGFHCHEDQQLLYPPLTAYQERLRLADRHYPTAKDRIANTGFMMGIVLAEAARLAGGRPEDMFIHAVMGDRWCSIDVYKDEVNRVRHYSPGPQFVDLIDRFWTLDDVDQRWSIMEMGTVHDRFDVFFLHPGEVDVDKRDIDWRAIALKRRYGDRTIFYPRPDWMANAM